MLTSISSNDTAIENALPNCGDCNACSNAERILTREKLRGDDIIALARNKVSAIRIKQFYPSPSCSELSDRMLGSRLYGRYVNANDIGRAGQAYFESQADEESRERYENDAVLWIEELRKLCLPHLSPFDKFRLELDEQWKAGARLATLNQKKMFAGLARHFGAGSEAEPHQDVFEWDTPESPEAEGLISQLAMNIYLTTANRGGALVLWDKRFSRQEYEAHRIPGSYGVRRDSLPNPVAVIEPEVGELILFNSRNVHAVTKIESGDRVSWSAFVGYRTALEPLTIWS